MTNHFPIAFFPFTFISDALASACHDRFGPVVVYQPAAGCTPAPLEALAASGRIILRFPVRGEDRRLAELARHFQSWGQLHSGDAAALKKFAENGFYNQEFAPEIRTEILKGERAPEPDPGPVFHARLFLLLAQEYDQQATELREDLERTDSAGRALFARMKGDAEEFPGFSADFGDTARAFAVDPGAYMTGPRLRAWRRLMAADPDPPRLLITSSAAVIDDLRERHETFRPVDTPPEEIFSGPAPSGGLAMDFYRIEDWDCIVGCLPGFEQKPEKSDPTP